MSKNPSPTTESPNALPSTRWPLERVLFAMAGTVTLLGALLAALVSPRFLLLTGFVGISQWAYVLVRTCPASMVLQRFGPEPQCRW